MLLRKYEDAIKDLERNGWLVIFWICRVPTGSLLFSVLKYSDGKPMTVRLFRQLISKEKKDIENDHHALSNH